MKNEIVVANVSSKDWRWNGSSLGPTWDGRIKPDLAAQGNPHAWSVHMPEMTVDLDYVRIEGPNARSWDFDATTSDWSWAGGFGDGGWWERFNVSDMHQGDGTFSSIVNPSPWGQAWVNRPFVATLKEPDAVTPLEFDGHPDDVVHVRYRTANAPLWEKAPFEVRFGETAGQMAASAVVPLQPDGEWHEAVFPASEFLTMESGPPSITGVRTSPPATAWWMSRQRARSSPRSSTGGRWVTLLTSSSAS